MAYESRITRYVEFADTDMAGIMHFSAYYRYMEAAEHALFRSVGLSVHMELDGRMIVWPRVHAACDFHAPLRFEDEVEVHVLVREKSKKTITCTHIFRKRDGGRGKEVARGVMTLVCAEMKDDGMKAIEIPPPIGKLLEVAPPQAFQEKG